MKTEPNESMHPIADNVLICDKGLTKREYFAAMAMQGILADKKLYHSDDMESACADAVKMADQLIEQLNQQQP